MMPPVGTKLGRYEIRSKLGAGGMGEVYLATDTKLDRQVALKILPPDVAEDRSRMNRFVQEAKAASALNHPNIITIHEIDETNSGHFIATEFIDGVTVRDCLRKAPLTLSEALNVATQIAAALAAAHKAGIIHRDIKPENVMVRADGLVKVLDFGLAKLSHDKVPMPDDPTRPLIKTGAGMVMGTAQYMSPEQARGLEVDARTDIFSLGAVLHEMITAEAPFRGETASDVIASILKTEPPLLSHSSQEVPAELERIVTKALEKDREERYQTVQDMLLDLRRLKKGLTFEAEQKRVQRREPNDSLPTTRDSQFTPRSAVSTTRVSVAPTASSAEYLVTEIKRHKVGVLLALALFIIAGVGVAYLLYQWTRTKPPSSTMKIARITNTGKTSNAAISPDGKYVVYSMAAAGRQSLWLGQVAISSDVQILPPAEVEYGGLTFSQDGNLVYYVIQKPGEPLSGVLYQAASLGGGAQRKLLTNVHSAVTLSPDGKQLAFVRKYPRSPIGDSLMVADVDGTDEKTLFTLKQPDLFGQSAPAWSPDGKIIACGRQNYSGTFYTSVIGVRVADGAETPISSQRWAGLSIGRLAWMADGSGLVFTVPDGPGNPSQIWHLPYPEGEARRIVTDLDGYSDVTTNAASSILATVRTNRVVNIWVTPIEDVGSAKQITSGEAREDGANGIDWTPDGRIVFRSAAGGENIWIMAADGTGIKQLVAGGTFPKISADGHYVVWARATANSVLQIWRMDLDGGNERQLTEIGGSGTFFPRLSPDGKWVVYGNVPDGGSHSLWKVSIDGGTPIQLTNHPTWVPNVSPDGKLIACTSLDQSSGQWKLAVIPFEGGLPIKTFEVTGSYNRPLLWTPDGRAIAYIQTSAGVSNIWAQPIDGGSPKQLTDFKDHRIFNFAWSRDGKKLALSRGLINSDVVLISNFR